MIKFEGYERRIDKIMGVLKEYGIASLEDAQKICLDKGVDCDAIVKGIQPIAFDNAVWAYTVGCAIAIKKNCKKAADAAEAIGIGLQSFCIGIARSANKVRKEPLQVILNGLGKDAAFIISRINGFTYVQTDYDQYTDTLKVVKTTAYSDGERAKVRCYGANDVNEGVAIMRHESVDVSITGNSTNPTRFQHPVAGTYKKWCWDNGKKYFSVASGGGTGRTLHPDNMAAGPASYGMTDTMGRMHSDAQFAGSSSVPAHVEMMGLIGMGNNPMVGATVACAVAVQEGMNK